MTEPRHSPRMMDRLFDAYGSPDRLVIRRNGGNYVTMIEESNGPMDIVALNDLHQRFFLLPRPVARLRRAVEAFRLGLGFGYPVCCVVAFCWSDLLGRAPGLAYNDRHGRSLYDRHETDRSYVPCRLHDIVDPPEWTAAADATDEPWRAEGARWWEAEGRATNGLGSRRG